MCVYVYVRVRVCVCVCVCVCVFVFSSLNSFLGPMPPDFEVLLITFSYAPQWVELLRTSDRPVAETST
jgi:hypothetical protein